MNGLHEWSDGYHKKKAFKEETYGPVYRYFLKKLHEFENERPNRFKMLMASYFTFCTYVITLLCKCPADVLVTALQPNPSTMSILRKLMKMTGPSVDPSPRMTSSSWLIDILVCVPPFGQHWLITFSRMSRWCIIELFIEW